MTFITWNNNNFKWDELAQAWELVQEITTAAKVDPSKIEKLDKKKKKKLVRLIMHMNNIEIYDEEKEIKNITHKIEDIKLIAEEIEKNVQIIYG
tara:strand:+ start:367 stop:648 length:282 start_codon:yes stop_codon:yes gene_type:complete